MIRPGPLHPPRRRAVGLTTAAALVASLLTYTYLDRETFDGRDVTAAGPGSFRAVPVERVPPPADGGTWSPPAATGWPAAGSVEMTLTSGTASAKAGGIPVKVSARTGKPAPKQVKVTVLPQRHAEQLGLSGPAFTVDGDSGEFDATFDVRGLKGLAGGDWASRMTLTGLPGCAATTPTRSECQDAAAVPVVKSAGVASLTTSVVASAGGASVFAVTAETESEEGDHKATDLKASGSWTAGDGSGAFTYTNQVRLPQTAGVVPKVALAYSSQVVDGRMAGSNNQASWVGDGWEYAPGFVERSYVACADDQEKQNGVAPNNGEKKDRSADQCWKESSPSVTVSVGDINTSLVKDDRTGAWRPQKDVNLKVELAGAPATRTAGTSERWIITTAEGTQHHFASEAGAAKSRWTMPVFGNHPGEECNAAEFKKSACHQAWRWLLDKTVDVHGNVTRYYYSDETGHYGAANDKNNRVSLIRGGHLDRIEYGLHVDHPNTPAAARVLFSTADRCFDNCYRDGKPVKESWPDVPWDRECAAEPCTDKLAPVFFSTKRLTKITTQVRRDSNFSDVESWTLHHEFKAPKEKRSASLWLKEIVHAGHVGGTVTNPPVQFTGVELANNVNSLPGSPLFARWRIQNIRTESGADIHVKYSDADCDTKDLPKPESNNRLCYPVYWTPDGYYEPKLDWFRKYKVLQVTESDRTANQLSIMKTYDYSTEGGGTDVLWAWDDSEFTKKKHRTYGQWRGYARVTTTVGDPSSKTARKTRKRFYRGLDDDPLPGEGRKRDVRVTDSAGSAHVDSGPLAGATLEDATLDGDAVVEATTTSYWMRETASRTRTGGSDKAHVTAPEVQSTRRLLTPGVWQRSETRTAYNDEGQPTAVSDLGDVKKSGDETCRRTSYVSNDAPWLRGVVSRVETVARSCDQTPSRPADVVSDVKSFHDGSDVHGAAPGKGTVTREDTLDRWENGPVYATTARTTVDSLGRVIGKTNPSGHTTRTEYTPPGPGMTTRQVTTNPKGHSVVLERDPAFTEPAVVTDANQRKTIFERDPLGRLAKVWLPGRRKGTQSPSLEFGYRIRTDGPLAVTSKRLGPNGKDLTEVKLFDSLYRSVQVQQDALGGTRLVRSTSYDDRGQKAYESGPNHAAGKPAEQLLEITPGTDRNRTVSTYDAVGRVVDESVWSYNRKLWSTTTSYGGNPDGWQVAVTPPNGGTPTATITDIRGAKTEVRQFRGSRPEGPYDATSYTYTARGDLATTTKGNRTWRYEHDLRGREVRTVDPDKGTATLRYDNADNLLSSTDANGSVVSTDYDELGRQTKQYFDGQLASEKTYDTLEKGHLTKTTSYVDGQAFTRQIGLYNDAYQVEDEELVIPAMPGLEKLAGKFVTTTHHNPDGSVKRISKPKVGSMEGEIVDHAYDDFGNVTRMIGTSSPSGTVRVYVDKSTYSPYGEVQTRNLGVNDAQQAFHTYVYDDATRRLKEFYFDREATLPNVAAVKYSYDDAGNVLSMANRPLDKDDKVRSNAEDVQCFGYDHLRRLVEAWSQTSELCADGPSAATIGGVAPYGRSYEFDAAGSRTKVTDHRAASTTTYGYDDNSPSHAIRTVTRGDKVERYDWDAVGNLASRKAGDVAETFSWNPQGKLTKIRGVGGDTRMVYDSEGTRLARIDPDGSATVHVAGHEYTSNSRGVSTTRHYQHAGDVVASRTDDGKGPGPIIWLGADHHGTAVWAVNSVTRVETVKYTDPYGDQRAASSGPAWPAGTRGYVGGTEDPSKLVLLGARYYSPALGAFISVDPKTDEYDPQRLHPYAYSNNSPVTFSDPDGLFFGFLLTAVARIAAVVRAIRVAAAVMRWFTGNFWRTSNGGRGNNSWRPSNVALNVVRTDVPTPSPSPQAPPTPPGAADDEGGDDGCDACVGMAKGGSQNKRDSGLRDVTDDELFDLEKRSKGAEKRKYQTELKARGLKHRAGQDSRPKPAPGPPGSRNSSRGGSSSADDSNVQEYVAGGVAVGATGATIWWLAKILSPLCGPAAPVCVVVL